MLDMDFNLCFCVIFGCQCIFVVVVITIVAVIVGTVSSLIICDMTDRKLKKKSEIDFGDNRSCIQQVQRGKITVKPRIYTCCTHACTTANGSATFN